MSNAKRIGNFDFWASFSFLLLHAVTALKIVGQFCYNFRVGGQLMVDDVPFFTRTMADLMFEGAFLLALSFLGLTGVLYGYSKKAFVNGNQNGALHLYIAQIGVLILALIALGVGVWFYANYYYWPQFRLEIPPHDYDKLMTLIDWFFSKVLFLLALTLSGLAYLLWLFRKTRAMSSVVCS